MPEQLNNREYHQILRGMKDARELFDEHYYKEALLALRKPCRILENQRSLHRNQALVYIQRAEVFIALNRDQKAACDLVHAQEILDRIGDQDESVRKQIQTFQDQINHRTSNSKND
ncbi:MAG: hypothetical protein Q4A59_02750 [Erysipelotrichaceae bacterium]|nr:hypothetical protein [Erysipelotrichaceae bacterium]